MPLRVAQTPVEAQLASPPVLEVAPLSPNETHPDIKTAAIAVAVGLTTYEANDTVDGVASRLPGEAMGVAGALHVPGAWSRGRVIYPQFGGLEPNSASVMVVIEQMIGAPDGVRVYVRTLDIRMARTGGAWRFAELASVGGDPIAPPAALPEVALAVLNDPRIELPDSARWDIFSGRVSPRLLGLMARMADQAPYGVVTLISGHPWEIFGTDRQSDHTRGLAVDLYRVGDAQVIDDRAEGGFTHGFVQWLYDQPDVARVGSPWALDGFGGRSFTDALHLDHLHIAVPAD